METPPVEQIDRTGSAHVHTGTWHDSPSVCALTNDHRHLGHVVRARNRWIAFDATHTDAEGSGFRFLGFWLSAALAKCAVELATAGACDSNFPVQ